MFLLNPEGFEHAPFSKDGCILFAKLQQYAGTEQITIDTNNEAWPETNIPGVARMTLVDDGQGNSIRLGRVDPGCHIPAHDHVGGEEIFVIEGEIADEYGEYPTGTWIRQEDGSRHEPFSKSGCLLYIKRGHLRRD